MERDILEMWKESLEKRQDLACLHKNKEINISLVSGDKTVLLSFRSGEIKIDKHISTPPDLIVETNSEIMNKLILGKEKITSIPNHSIEISGKYRDVLFLESVFYLNS